MFDEKTKQQLKSYVYFLIDPSTKKPFYVGKGNNDRVFDHMRCALELESVSDKYDIIRRIHSENKIVEHIIVRHGLTDIEAFEIEAALIDVLDYLSSGLTNISGGQKSIEKGLMTSDEIIRLYNAQPLTEISSDCLIININKQYKRGLGKDSVYTTTETKINNSMNAANLVFLNVRRFDFLRLR